MYLFSNLCSVTSHGWWTRNSESIYTTEISMHKKWAFSVPPKKLVVNRYPVYPQLMSSNSPSTLPPWWLYHILGFYNILALEIFKHLLYRFEVPWNSHNFAFLHCFCLIGPHKADDKLIAQWNSFGMFDYIASL